MVKKLKYKVSNKIKSVLKRFAPIYNKSFSQCGEDMILSYYLKKEKGFYVDIGAFHPEKLSNTCHFYLKGWNGINIDGNKESIELFKIKRRKDINVHACIGLANKETKVDFYQFKTAELNTFKSEALPDILKYHGQSPIMIEEIELKSLASVLDHYMQDNQEIDFMTIDAEGADFEILMSNNWDKYRPKLIVVENHLSVYDFIQSEMHNFLCDKKYTLGGYSRHSYLFYEQSYSSF